MIIHYLPHQNNVQQIGYKLLSMLNFKGKKGEEVARTLISACLWKGLPVIVVVAKGEK